MIFLDFIWLFIFMVLIDSRPMFKRMDENYIYDDGVRHNNLQGPVYSYDNYNRKFTAPQNEKNNIESHEIDLSGFEKFITHDLHHTSKKHHILQAHKSHKNLSKMLMELTTDVEYLKKMYNSEDLADSMFRHKVTEGLKQASEDNSFIDSTAEIETVLNEIKQRALKMMMQHIPSSGNIINTAVTEIMYDVGSLMYSPKMTSRDNLIFKKSVLGDTDSVYNRNSRSIYNKAATMAHDLECNLQNKVIKTYEIVKHKVSANLGEELKHSEKAIKEAVNKLSGGKTTCKPKPSKSKTLSKSKVTSTTTAPIKRKSTLRHYTKRKFFSRKTTSTPTHTIPKVADDFSMLSVYEKILMNAQDDNTRLLKTNTPQDHQSIKYTNLKRSAQELYEDLPDVSEEYDEDNNVTLKNEFRLTEPLKNETSISDDDISFNTLSNKLSYNDYVNGFKYYLNFQKDQANENFSNVVRYQAHKHHNVEDVGKYILEKLPQLPSTRQRRFFFEQDTLEDQDISTKSDDSWFKKHFYFFIDKDPPKKYHTMQTVSLKERQNTTILFNEQSLKQNKTHSKIKRSIVKRNRHKTKLNTLRTTTTLFGKNSKKNGVFDVNLVQRPTAVIKLKNKGKKRKFKNIFKKLSFRKESANTKNMARDEMYRIKRSNPFKILKDIVLRNRYTDSDNKVRKLFDYDVVTTSLKPNYNFINHNNQLPNIEALLGEIPNITSKSETHDYDQYYLPDNDMSIIYNKGLYSTKEIPLFISNEMPLLSDLPLESTTQNTYTLKDLERTRFFDDIINIRVKAASDQGRESTLNSEEIKKIDPLLENLLGTLSTENFSSSEVKHNNFNQDALNKSLLQESEFLGDIYKTNIKKIQPNKYSYKLILYNDNKKEKELRNEDPWSDNQQILSKRAKQRNILFKHRKVLEKNLTNTNTATTKGNNKTNRNKIQKPHPSHSDKKPKPKKHPTTKKQNQQKAHPDHFFTTPLPMSENEFNKFLEENHIDVKSVTAPLSNSIPFSTHVNTHYGVRIDSKSKPHQKYMGTISNQKYKMKHNNNNYYTQHGRNKRDKVLKKSKLPKLSAKPVLEENITITPKNEILTKDNYDVKRSIKNCQTFTAHDVAALEIIVDLKKCSELNQNENVPERTLNSMVIDNKPKITNSIQVHIALPDNYSETIKRSPESVQVKKIFSAIMASPVDIEYQLHTLEKTTVPSTTIEESKLSPGLYLLVENSNMSDPTAQLILKPMKMDVNNLNLELTTNESLSEPQTTTPYTNDNKENSFEECKYKRSINLDAIKRFFGHDRVCRCRCKANQTMCKACAASNAVMTELIFEFDNLAKYMRDHCTEIQTFFWMNPTGGKKLRESVNKINKSLNDYYKRVKGKCNGRTCKMFSSGIDKRSLLHEFNENSHNGSLPFLLNVVNNDLEIATRTGLFYDEKFIKHAQSLQNSIDNCLSRILVKRSDVEKGYSLDKININLISNPNFKKSTLNKALYKSKNKAKALHHVDSNSFLNNDLVNYTFKKEEKKRLRDFVRHRFQSKISKDSNTLVADLNINNGSINLRQRRKTKPIVNVLLLKNYSSNCQNKSGVYDSRSFRSLATKKLYDYSNDDSLVHSMNKLFKLIGHPDANEFTSRQNTNCSTLASARNDAKTRIGNKSTTNILHTTKHHNTSKTSKASFTTPKSEIINTMVGFTKHFLSKIFHKPTNTTVHSERHIRNVTIDTNRMLNTEPIDLNSHRISSVTERENPTIIILDENSETFDGSKNEKVNDNDLKSLLFSVLNYSSKVLNTEWVRAVNPNIRVQKSYDGMSKKSNKTKKGFVSKLAEKFSWSKFDDKQKKQQLEVHKKSTLFRTIDANNMDKTRQELSVLERSTLTSVSKSLPFHSTKIGGRNLTVCDIASTWGHILNTQRTMTKADFERYVKKINCNKYTAVPEKFVIRFNRRRKHCKTAGLKHPRWCRDSKEELYEDDDLPELDESDTHIYTLHENNEFFERFIRGKRGLYEPAPRRIKRHSKGVIDVLTNLPPLKPLTDEVFAMIGDSIVLNCNPLGYKQELKDVWIASQKTNNTNVSKLYIRNVRKEDAGIYVCYNDDNIIVQSVKVTVMDAPKFNVVFATVYKTPSSCTYNDLRVIQKVGEVMRQLICGNYCSVRIDEPVCLKDRKDELYFLRTLTVILPEYPSINCSVECRRNLRGSLAVLYAKNAPVLASIPVTMMYYNGSLLEEVKIWTPSMRELKAFVSHTLRTSDSNGHKEYNSLADTNPGTIHVLVSCPAGFFLVSTQKICGLCPANTYSIEGGNCCIKCPEGTMSEPGAAFCRGSLGRFARSIWTNTICVSQSFKTICVMAFILIILYSYHRFANLRPPKKSNQKQDDCASTDQGLSRIRKNNRPPLPPLDF